MNLLLDVAAEGEEALCVHAHPQEGVVHVLGENSADRADLETVIQVLSSPDDVLAEVDLPALHHH
eukprot:16443496-Heterocapsa_arctica.AAC.1